LLLKSHENSHEIPNDGHSHIFGCFCSAFCPKIPGICGICWDLPGSAGYPGNFSPNQLPLRSKSRLEAKGIFPHLAEAIDFGDVKVKQKKMD
jgi:hypothetical protein